MAEKIELDLRNRERSTKRIIRTAAVWITLLAVFLLPIPTYAARHSIDVENSVLTVRVYKSGLFSIFAHDHEIRTPIMRGEVDDSDKPSVELWVDADKLRVVDSELSAKNRADVQKTMEGPEVLDIRRFPVIHFRSTAIEKMGANHWVVRGELDLHGQSRPVAVEVSEKDGRYQGSVALKQRNFGITPVRIVGGTVSVKDQIKVEFEVVAVR